jgi:hypothetical protein
MTGFLGQAPDDTRAIVLSPRISCLRREGERLAEAGPLRAIAGVAGDPLLLFLLFERYWTPLIAALSHIRMPRKRALTFHSARRCIFLTERR